MGNLAASYYLSCGIYKKWHSKTLKEYTNDPTALLKMTNYVKKSKVMLSKGVGCYLFGLNGTGKSLLMNCVFKELIDQRYKVRIITYTELIDAFVNKWDSARASDFNSIRNVQFLGIEEIGKEFKGSKDTSLSKVVLDEVLRYRVQMGLPTWFTSNLKPSSLTNIYAKDTLSLLNESTITVEVIGEDYRTIIRDDIKNLI